MTTSPRVRTEIAIASSRMRRDASSSRNSRHARRYFLSAAFFSAGALDADFAIDVVGTMMWAYGVPFPTTNGSPVVQPVGNASTSPTPAASTMTYRKMAVADTRHGAFRRPPAAPPDRY